MSNPENDPPPAGTSAPADSPAPAARNRSSIIIIVVVLVLIVAVCCGCLLAAGIVWYMRQGNPPLFEDMLQVFTPAFSQVLG